MHMKFEETLPKILRKSAGLWAETTAQISHAEKDTYRMVNYPDLYALSMDFASALMGIGVHRGDRIGLISENREEWEQADMGILAIGAVDTPRGCDSSEADISYILSFSETKVTILENENQTKKILRVRKDIPTLETVIVFDKVSEETVNACKEAGLQFHQFRELQKQGHLLRRSNPDAVEAELEKGKSDDLATIIFTSGTTGTPKGVMLTHANIICQLDSACERIFLNPGERVICVLPVWHAFQRAVEYIILAQGATICYSKPVASYLMADMQKLNPHVLPTVPRVWTALYDAIWKQKKKTGGITLSVFKFFTTVSLLWCKMDRKLRRKNSRFGNDYIVLWWFILFIPWLVLLPLKLIGKIFVFAPVKKLFGSNFRNGITGGGAFPENVDAYFWATGINVIEAYGLTETSPIVCCRPVADPVFRNVGTAFRHMEFRIVDDDGMILGPGMKGSLQIRGGCIMQGYYKRPDLTQKAMTVDGWFDTGDLAVLTVDRELQLRGRKKDTIVLQGGENIEPVPIEAKINESPYIQASVVLGTNEEGIDQKFLTALILPVKDNIESYAHENGLEYESYEELAESNEIKKLLEAEINNLVTAKNGFKSFERINKIAVFTKPFEVGVEVSAKMEMMRHKIHEMYRSKIAQLYSED